MRQRTNNNLHENDGSPRDLQACDKQYYQLPFAHCHLERRRDLAALGRGGQRFPLRWCVTMLSLGVLVPVVLMPLIAMTRPGLPRTDIVWWKAGVLYHVYVRSFYDSNADGVGDLQGIREKLDYLASLKVRALQLSPINPSPMVDFGYDISNYTDIDPAFGTLQEFDELIADMHERGMKLVLDFVPNHSSSKHRWFELSCQRHPLYADYYVWSDGKRNPDGTRSPPNNWLSSFGGSAWTWHEGRGQYYYHKYDKEMPDLNYNSHQVRKEMKDVLRFWLDRGVDGFRVDVMEGLAEVQDLTQDEPRTYREGRKPEEYHYLEHIYTMGQRESLVILAEFRQVMTEYERKLGKHLFLLPEVNIQHKNPQFWKETYRHGASMPTNKALINALHKGCSGQQVHEAVENVMSLIPFNKGDHWIDWRVNSHDHSRLSTRFGPQYVELGLALTLLLPGTGTIYYGQELGLQDLRLTYEQTVDPKGRNAGKLNYDQFSRDPGRGPMQWNSQENAGFTAAQRPWLPVKADYTTRNAKEQLENPASLLNCYRRLLALKEKPAFLLGQHNPMIVNDNIYSFARINRGRIYPRYMVAVNVGEEPSTDNYRTPRVTLKVPEDDIEVPVKIPVAGHLVYHSVGFTLPGAKPTSAVDGFIEQAVNLTNLTLAPGQVVVVRL